MIPFLNFVNSTYTKIKAETDAVYLNHGNMKTHIMLDKITIIKSTTKM